MNYANIRAIIDSCWYHSDEGTEIAVIIPVQARNLKQYLTTHFGNTETVHIIQPFQSIIGRMFDTVILIDLDISSSYVQNCAMHRLRNPETSTFITIHRSTSDRTTN